MLNIGILGAGGIAALSHLPEIADVPGMRVTHICGRQERRLRLLCQRFDVPRYSTSWTALLDDETLDAVIVALPHPLHAEAGLAALERGLHLFMQKPLCATLAEADALVAASETRPDQIVYCRPAFDAVVYEMRSMLQSGAIGQISGALARHSHGGPEVYYAEVSDAFEEPRDPNNLWFFDADRAGGGALIDMGVYSIANLVALLGKADHVTARLATLAKPTRLEDTASLILEFATGALATAETSWCDPARSSYLRLHGTAGKLIKAGDSIKYVRPSSYEREWAAPLVDEIIPPRVANQHEEWLRCIERGQQPALSNLWTARHVMELMLAAERSHAAGRRVPINSAPRLA